MSSHNNDNPFTALDKKAFRPQQEQQKVVKTIAIAHPVDEDEDMFTHTMHGVTPLSGKTTKKKKAAIAPQQCTLVQEIATETESEQTSSTDKTDAAQHVASSIAISEINSSSAAGKHPSFCAQVRGLSALQQKHSVQADRKELAKKRSRQAVHEQTTRAATAPVLDDTQLFAQSVQDVQPIATGLRHSCPVPKPVILPPQVDPYKELQELLDGNIEFSLEYSEEFLQGHVVGADPLILHRLRQGQFYPEKHLDLHGQNSQQAYDSLVSFMRHSYQRGIRTALIVTGRGKNSPDGTGVLRQRVQEWFVKEPFKRVVFAFCTALPRDGGAGALYVLLRKMKKKRGKILWDCPPPDADFF